MAGPQRPGQRQISGPRVLINNGSMRGRPIPAQQPRPQPALPHRREARGGYVHALGKVASGGVMGGLSGDFTKQVGLGQAPPPSVPGQVNPWKCKTPSCNNRVVAVTGGGAFFKSDGDGPYCIDCYADEWKQHIPSIEYGGGPMAPPCTFAVH